jgi:TfuA protein
VVGSSSMGALRAAEMDTLGMTGIGEVYRMYRSEELVSDDEVALVFDPETGLSLSEPLVNIRFTLREAERLNVITQQDHGALLVAAQSVFYPQRTYGRIVSAAGAAVDQETRERFLTWVKLHAVDQKRNDAVAALEHIRELAQKPGTVSRT